jgi:deaminated glutathione amidase
MAPTDISRFSVPGTEPRSDTGRGRLRVACVQLAADEDKAANVARAAVAVWEAADRGAELVLLPEKWNVIGERDALEGGAEPLDGPTLTAVREWARELGISIVAGSIVERVDGQDRLSNTSALVDAEGRIAATYRKIHMFDVVVAGVRYRESDHEQAGAEIVTAAVGDVPLGLTVCYDLRFPELYRILALHGAELITVPAAFTLHTGKDHWEVLLRARAIENQCFVMAADVIGEHGGGKVSYGRSMIVDPWGVVLAQAPDAEAVIVADLDFAMLERVRASLPSLASRVPASYRWPEPSAAPG